MTSNGIITSELGRDDVKEFYGNTLQKCDDLATDVTSCDPKKVPKYMRKVISLVHEDVRDKYFGCGMVIPEALTGQRILDLGCGSGRDCFILAKFVGKDGHVTGLDMTEPLLDVAKKYVDYHAKQFGYSEPNTEFVLGYMEKLEEAGIKDSSYDILISNCVINLTFDKPAVLKEAYRALKEGGEMYFSDMYVNCELPQEIRKDKVLWGEGIAGALYWKDIAQLTKECGFLTPRLVEVKPIHVRRPAIKKLLGDAKYVSATYRLFKVSSTSERGAMATYKGGIEGHETEFKFDIKHTFKVGEPLAVDSQLASIIQNSRFKESFTLESLDASSTPKMEGHINPFTHLCDG